MPAILEGSPEPSARARELVRGAFDLHVHVEPDVIPRKTSDLALAARFQEVGLASFALKSHYTMTAERAAVVSAASGLPVLGGITLNWSMGGINPVAVEVCARSGGRFAWLPTADAGNQLRSEARQTAPGRQVGFTRVRQEMAERGLVRRPIEVLDPSGSVLPEVREVLEVVAHYQMVLCTGHLGGPEIDQVVGAAIEQGVTRIIITHPEFPSQQLAPCQQRALAGRGCFLERCFGTPYAGRVSWERLFANIRAGGPLTSLLSSDLGQPDNPPVEDGLALLADRMVDDGFSDAQIRTMAVGNSRWLAGMAAGG